MGILLEEDFVPAALGVMRAGAAYVPLSLDSPPERLQVEIAEAGITHLVTRTQHPLAVDPDSQGELRPLPEVTAESLAYCVFTSGSSGRPKAVEIRHSSLSQLVEHYRVALPFGPQDRMAMLANPVFDASVGDIWPILACGGTLVLSRCYQPSGDTRVQALLFRVRERDREEDPLCYVETRLVDLGWGYRGVAARVSWLECEKHGQVMRQPWVAQIAEELLNDSEKRG